MRLVAWALLAVAFANRIDAARDSEGFCHDSSPLFLHDHKVLDNGPTTAVKRSLSDTVDSDSIVLMGRGEGDEGKEEEEEGLYIGTSDWEDYAHNPSLRDWSSFTDAVPVPPPSQEASSTESQPKAEGGRRRIFGLLGRALGSASSKADTQTQDDQSRRTPLVVGNYVLNYEPPYPSYGRQAPQTLTEAASDAATSMQHDHDANKMGDVDRLLQAQRDFSEEDLDRWLQDQTVTTKEEERAYRAKQERKRRSRLRSLKIDEGKEDKAERVEEALKESPISSHDSTTIIMNPPEVSRYEDDIFYSTPETDIHRGSSSKLTSTLRKPRSKDKYKPRSISLAELRRRKQREEERGRQQDVDVCSDSGKALPGRARIYNAFQKSSSSISRAERNKIKAEILKGVSSGFSGIKNRLTRAVSQYSASSASDSDTASKPDVQPCEEQSKGGKAQIRFNKRSSQSQYGKHAACAVNEITSLPQRVSMSRFEDESNETFDGTNIPTGDPFGELGDYTDATQFFDSISQCCCPPHSPEVDPYTERNTGPAECENASWSDSQRASERRLVKRSPIVPVSSDANDVNGIDEAISWNKRGVTNYPLEFAAKAESMGRGLRAEKYLFYKDLATQGKVSRAWGRSLDRPAHSVPETNVRSGGGVGGSSSGDHGGGDGGKAESKANNQEGRHELDELNLPDAPLSPASRHQSEEEIFDRIDRLYLSREERMKRLEEGLDPSEVQQRASIRASIRAKENEILNESYDVIRKVEESEEPKYSTDNSSDAPQSPRHDDKSDHDSDSSHSSASHTDWGSQPGQHDTRNHEARLKEANARMKEYLAQHNRWSHGHQTSGNDANKITPDLEADLAKELEKLEGLHPDPNHSNAKQDDLKEAEKHFREYLAKNHIIPPKPIFTSGRFHDETEQRYHEHLANQYGLSLDILNHHRPPISPIVQSSVQPNQQVTQEQHQDKLFDVLDEYSRKDQPK